MFDLFEVAGVEDAWGTRFIHVRQGDRFAILPVGSFTASNKYLGAEMSRFGLHLADKAQKEALIDKVRAVSTYDPAIVPTAPGWHDGCYVLADGTVLSAPGDRQVLPGFVPNAFGIAAAGDGREWRFNVASPLKGQSVAATVMMAMFLPPIMQFMPLVESLAIELVGPAGIGKTTVSRLASSIIGGVGLGSSQPYPRQLASIMADPGAELSAYRDHPVIIEAADAYQVTATLKQRRAAYNFIANELPALSRSGPGKALRTVALITGRRSLRELAEVSASEIDGLLTLRFDADRPHGIFDSVPVKFGDGAAFADALSAAAATKYGTAYRHFLSVLSTAQVAVPERLPAMLADLQDEFLRHVQASEASGLSSKAARSFAAIYAAGKYAQACGALPKKWDCLNAAITCYDLLHSAAAPAEPLEPLAALLERLIDQGAFMKVDQQRSSLIQVLQAKSKGATLWIMDDHRELRIHPSKLLELIPDWKAREKGSELAELLIHGDGRHLRRKATLAPGVDVQRLICLRLPVAADATSDSIFDDGVRPDPKLV